MTMALARRNQLMTTSLNTLVFHDSDPDGWGAAWSIRNALPKATFIKLRHGTLNYINIVHAKSEEFIDIIPSKTNLIITDLSFDREQTLILEKIYASVTVIDHHISAKRDLGDLDYAFIDVNKSAAMLAWEFFHDESAPTLIKYIQDYDIWTKELDHTEEINLVIQSSRLSFDRLDELDCQLGDPGGLKTAIREGTAIRTFRDNQVRIIVNRSGMAKFTVGDINLEFACANSPLMESQIGNIISKGKPFAAVWHQISNGDYKYSLRSREGGVDVSVIAETFGGGGHSRAAGFKTKEKIHELTQ